MLNTVRERARLVGPGLVWAAAAIGSGEVIIGTKIGAEHGYAFIWALWVGVLLKWSIHRGVLDLTLQSGRSVVDRWHDLRFGWAVSWYWLVFFLLTITGLSGLLGLTAAALHEVVPAVSDSVWAVVITVAVAALVYYERYQGFEKLMLTMCLVLVISVIGAVVLARPEPLDIVGEWSVPSSVSAGLLLLSLLGWGAGSGPDLILPYSTWVLEKARLDWADQPSATPVSPAAPAAPVSPAAPAAPAAPATGTAVTRVRPAPRVVRLGRFDLGSGYVVTAFVASGFMIAGAALLAPRGLVIDDDGEVISTLSRILTDSYGAWAFGIVIAGVAAALLSTFIGVLDGSYLTVHRLVSLLRGRTPAVVADRSRTLGRAATLALFAVTPLILLLVVRQPVTLVIISGLVSAVSMPVLGALVFFGLWRSEPGDHRPSRTYLGAVVLATVLYLALMVISISQLG